MPRCVSFRFRDSLTWASPDLSLRAVRVQALPSAPSGGDCPLFALLVLLTGLITQLTWDGLIGENQSILLARGGRRERGPPAPRSIRPRRLPCHGELRKGGLWFGTSEGRRQFPRRQGGSCLASRCELGHLSQWDAEDLDQRGLAGPLPARHVTAPVVLCDARSLPRPGPLSEFF